MNLKRINLNLFLFKTFGPGTVYACLSIFFILGLYFGAMLSRDSDDEIIYTALASKLSASGYTSYNLRDLSIKPGGSFWKLIPETDGTLLSSLSHSGVTYYDTPLYFNPPLFPAFLSVSHKIFNDNYEFLALKRDKPLAFYGEQFYSTFPSVFFAVLLLLGVFFLSKYYVVGDGAGWAVLFLLASPVFLIATFKTWSDLMASAFLVWSYFLWQKKSNKYALRILFSGLLFGLGVLTRTNILFAAPIFLCKDLKKSSLFYLTVFLFVLPWFILMTRQYGNPFYFPEAGGAKDLDWLKSITRPWYFYIIDLMYLSPVFFLSVFAIRKAGFELFFWALCFIAPFSVLLYTQKPLGLEDRYLLPCYPALAILAAQGMEKLKNWIPKPAAIAVILFLLVWSVKISAALILARESLKFTPFN